MKPLFSDESKPSAKPVDLATPLPLDKQNAFNTVALEATSANSGALVPLAPAAATQVPAPRITETDIAELGAKQGTGLATVSSRLMASVKTSETGEFGKGLSGLVVLAKGLDPASLKNKGFLGKVFGRMKAAQTNLLTQYSTVERQMDALVAKLDSDAQLHTGRINDIEQMYVDNMNYHQELEQAQDQARSWLKQAEADFEAAKQIAVNDPFGAQRLADHARLIDRLSKRIDDIERAQMLSKQMAPQLRQMQEQARALVSKFGDVKAVTLPAWKNNFGQYVLALEQKEAVRVLAEVDAVTEAALRNGAELLRANAAGVAEARQRSVVSIETLEHVQANLMGSIEDVLRIDSEGRTRRAAEAPRLANMEKQLIEAFAPGKR